MPNVYIIAGPNGAGKTTFAREFLPKYANCKNFVNADMIAEGVSPFDPAAASFRAGRLMLEEIGLLSSRRLDFGFESTLSGKGHLQLMQNLKKSGYSVHLYFLWVSTIGVSLSRIQARVAAGGHDVPESTVRRRFEKSTSNFFRHYRPLADTWLLFDNSGEEPKRVALGDAAGSHIIDSGLFQNLESQYGNPR